MAEAELADRISESTQLAPERLADLTSRFVSVPSVNGEHPEKDLALVIAGELHRAARVVAAFSAMTRSGGVS